MVSAITLASRLLMGSPLCSYCQHTILHLLDQEPIFDATYGHVPFSRTSIKRVYSQHQFRVLILTHFLLWKTYFNLRMSLTKLTITLHSNNFKTTLLVCWWEKQPEMFCLHHHMTEAISKKAK